ncbi:MAG: LysR family transcriptional regulator [Deltaproteobacteria bacterium]|nr:LysR family transcriptional regulator [Deltaproteobacteria bacterium]
MIRDTYGMMHLEIKHLRMIRMIALTNNLTRAAEKLFISQPALSQQLKDIESKLGTVLFTRTGKNMILTRVGKKLLNYSKIIIDQIEEAELEVQKSVNGEEGELKIGVRCLYCYKWLPGVIKLFQDKYPNIDISIGNSFDPEKDIISKLYDIAIATSPVLNKKIASTPLFEDEFLCTMSDEHPLSKKKYLDYKDFHGVDMISMVDKAGPSFYNLFLKSKGVKPGRYMTITYPDAVVDLVEAGLGIAILPKWFISPYTKKKQIKTCHLTSKKTLLTWKASFLNEKSTSYQKEFIKIITSYPIIN